MNYNLVGLFKMLADPLLRGKGVCYEKSVYVSNVSSVGGGGTSCGWYGRVYQLQLRDYLI